VSDLHATIQKFSRRLRHEFATEIERDARGFKDRAVRLLKASLPPRPGRPSTEAVTHATEMKALGKGWAEIYAACLPSNASPDSRQVQQSRLRCAVRFRRNLQRGRKPVLISSAKKL
jgi:hypothetical protein